MIKLDEASVGTFSKCAEDEPVFVLRAQDKTAPEFVRMWAQYARSHGVGHKKTAEAMALAALMEDWQRRNASKVPD